MEKNDDILKLLLEEDEKSFNLREFINKLLHHWYWFVLTIAIGVGAAFLYNKYTPPIYEVTSKLLVKDKNDGGVSLGGMFDRFPMRSSVNLANHIGILTSYNLNSEVIQQLGWYVSWYRKMPLGNFDLYGREPFHVTFDPNDSNLENVPVFIVPVDTTSYIAKVDASIYLGGQPFDIQFETKGKYGEKFENNYFSFTINKSIDVGGEADFFVFNNLDNLTRRYVGSVSVSSVDEEANLLSVNISGNNPKREIDFINTLSEVYRNYSLRERNQISVNTINFIDQQLNAVVDTLKTTSDQFTNYRSSNRVYDLSQKAEIIMQKLNELDKRRSMAEMQLSYYEDLKTYMADGEKMKNITFPSVVGITDTGLNNLVLKLSELYGRKESLSYSLQAKNPTLVVVDRELEYTRKSLQENLNNLVFNTQRELDALNRQIYQVNSQLSDVPKTEQDLVNIKRMVDLNNDLYNYLLEKRAEAQITKASNLPEIEVLDPAQFATVTQIGPRTTINLAMGLMFGIFLPLFVIVMVDYFDDTIHSKEHLQELTTVPVVAEIIRSKFKESIPVIKYTRSVIAESFRKLRTNINYLQKGDNRNIIAVHSSVPGEGKTFVSANLASVMALNNKKVVLIGADMRKPTLHQYFNLKNDIGISTYLIGHNRLDEIIKPSGVENLDVLLCGLIPPNPADLLASDEFVALLNELKTRYDYIVIDNSPFSLVTDAAIVSKIAGVNLFVARQGYTHKKMIELLNYNIQQYDMHRVGIILNDINPKKYGSYATSYSSYVQNSLKSGSGYFDDNTKVKNGELV
ncbi:GumC family protein [Mangrovibacterium sp.]|uniref:GumC family protein n=1 Tax=Mangrovibacterium sp. TaxID=1961364 RepID=UPI00356B50B5